jgi:hypothetical protein
VAAPTRVRRGIMHRSAFPDALTWLAVHGRAPAVVDAWRSFVAESAPGQGTSAAEPTEDGTPRRRRRRRRRRGRFQRPRAE